MEDIKSMIRKAIRKITMKPGTKEITLEERRPIQLQMLAEFDKICRKHHLRYSLGYGTLLGAIRHKGFIPWDDDVDLIMPLPDMLKLKDILKSDILEIHDVDSDNNYEFSFPRLCFPKSFRRIGLIANGYGINIDLYIMMGISDDKDLRDIYFQQANKLQAKRLRARKIRHYLLYLLPIKQIPFFNRILRKYRDHMFYSPITVPFDEATHYFCASGYRDERSVYDFNVFSKLIDAQFEGLTLKITSQYEKYLTKEYGNYMQLPPEEDRHPYHGGHYYFKS